MVRAVRAAPATDVESVTYRRRTDGGRPDDRAVVETGAAAARDVVFSRFDNSEVRDVDVTVTFEDEILEVDVYLDVPDPGVRDPEQVADDAAVAARRAVDRLFADGGDESDD